MSGLYLTDDMDRNVAVAQANVTHYRKTLRETAEAADLDSLAGVLNALASAEGELNVITKLAQVVPALKTDPSLLDAALEEVSITLFSGPDDAWSGRSNEVRRARYDGVRKATKDALWYLRNLHFKLTAG